MNHDPTPTPISEKIAERLDRLCDSRHGTYFYLQLANDSDSFVNLVIDKEADHLIDIKIVNDRADATRMSARTKDMVIPMVFLKFGDPVACVECEVRSGKGERYECYRGMTHIQKGEYMYIHLSDDICCAPVRD